MQWLHSGCLSLHLILLLLQLKHPRLDFVCPFLGIGLRGSGGALSLFRAASGDSLDEPSMLLGGGGDSDMMRIPAFKATMKQPHGDIYAVSDVQRLQGTRLGA